MKTAKEFFEEESEKQWKNSNNGFASDPDSICRVPYIIRPKLHDLMDAYANQQLAEYKAKLKGEVTKKRDYYNEEFLNDSSEHAYGKRCGIDEILDLIDNL